MRKAQPIQQFLIETRHKYKHTISRTTCKSLNQYSNTLQKRRQTEEKKTKGKGRGDKRKVKARWLRNVNTVAKRRAIQDSSKRERILSVYRVFYINAKEYAEGTGILNN